MECTVQESNLQPSDFMCRAFRCKSLFVAVHQMFAPGSLQNFYASEILNYLVAEYRKSEKGNRHNMKTITLKPFALCFAIFGLGQIAFAQSDLKLPDVSQAAEVKQRIALTDIAINYHRPLVNGRKIWGGLVPYGKGWRAGANENTTIELSDAVSVEGKPLPKGVYGLHMIPNPDSCTVIFSKTNTGWGSYSYDQKDDALRVDVKPRPLAETKEALEFDFEDLKPTSTAVTLKWEKLGVPFTVSVNDADQTLQNIRAQLKGRGQFTWQALDEGAQFCLTRKVDPHEALLWAQSTIQNEERFDNLSTKADILKALNRSDDAKTTWNQALKIATAQQLYSYGRQLQSSRRDRNPRHREQRPLRRCAAVVVSRTNECQRNSAGTTKAQRAWPRSLHRGAPRRRKYKSDGVVGERFPLRQRLSFGYARG